MKQHFVVPASEEDENTSPNPLSNGSVFAGKFRLEEKIGQGSFGMIFKCVSIETQEILAIKLEKQNGKHGSMLIREIKVMMEMKNDKGFARMHSYGKDSEYNYVAMSYLGRNIDSLLKKCGGRFSTQTVVNIADQMISRLEAMHLKNLIHRDIKPENYVIGYGSNFTTIHLIDFGLAKYYKDSNGTHIPFVDKKGMIGTARYASVNAHLGSEQSRRDDLEALGYVLVYFAKGKLPWSNIYADTKDEKYEKIKNMKMQLSLENICEGLPSEFVLYFKHVKQLGFEEQPNYTLLKKLFAKIAADKKVEHQVHTLDWEGLPDYRQRRKYNTSAPAFASHSRIAAQQQQLQSNQQQSQQHQQLPVSQQVIPNKKPNNQMMQSIPTNLNNNNNNNNGIQGSSQNINNTAEQNLLLQYGGTTNTGIKIDSNLQQGLKSQQNTTVHAYHPLNTNPSIPAPGKQNNNNNNNNNAETGQKQQVIHLYETENANEPSVRMHLNPVIGGKNEEPLSNLNPLTSQQFLNVPNYDKATNSHSVNSANSGGTSRLNNYMWSDSEDVTSEEGIVVGDFISKQNQPFHTKNLFDDIRVKSSQIHIDAIAGTSVNPAEESPNQIHTHKTILTNSETKQFKPELWKMSTYIGENVNDLASEAGREVKILEVKMAFRATHKHE